MKRDLDLIRNILSTIEKSENPQIFGTVENLAEQMVCDDLGMLGFHVSLLVDCDYLKTESLSTIGEGFDDYLIYRLTSQGCDYLESIKDDTIWAKTKKVLEPIGSSCTLEIVKTVASKMILAHIGIS